GIPFVAVGE
ncbi:hypothetical protein CISIN_1g0155682mg, partial [Citrus sinensis]